MKVVENALAEFVETPIVWEAEIMEFLSTNSTMKRLSARQQDEYDNATRCYICRHEFVECDVKGPKVRDHDHITGWFIGAAHRLCNMKRPVSFYIPVFFHNFRGYDAHLIVHEFGKRPDREIKVIGQNMDKYLKVEWEKNMVFRDSLQFLPAFLELHAASLAKLAADISKIFTTWSRICTLRQTFSYSCGREFSAMITSPLSRGSMNPNNLYKRPSSLSSEAWSAHQRTTHTPSMYRKTSTARISTSTRRSTF